MLGRNGISSPVLKETNHRSIPFPSQAVRAPGRDTLMGIYCAKQRAASTETTKELLTFKGKHMNFTGMRKTLGHKEKFSLHFILAFAEMIE